jgi:hypothetical protein
MGFNHEANIQGGGKPKIKSSLKIYPEAFCRRVGGRGNVSPPYHHHFSQLIRGNFILK